MDPPHGCRPLKPCLLHHLHHHHHHHPLFLNPHHHHHLHHHHHFNCLHHHLHHHHLHPNFSSFPQNPKQANPLPFQTNLNSETAGLNSAYNYNPTTQVLQEQNLDDVELEEEEDDDPIFVLTDEWKEFFAKSEAKRKLERKQAKKGNK